MSLRGNKIGKSAAIEFARAAADLKHLVSISLADNRLGERDDSKTTRALAAMLAARDNWLRLDLSNNDFGDAG